MARNLYDMDSIYGGSRAGEDEVSSTLRREAEKAQSILECHANAYFKEFVEDLDAALDDAMNEADPAAAGYAFKIIRKIQRRLETDLEEAKRLVE